MKICKKCGLEKELEDFPKHSKCKDGRTHVCKECEYKKARNRYSLTGKDNMKRYYQKIKKDNDKYFSHLKKVNNYRDNNREKCLLLYCKNRVKTFNLPFNLELEDIIIPEYCPILEVKFNLNKPKRGRNMYGPSVDRIIPELGYVKGNIRIISLKANMMKSNASKEELLIFSKNIINYINE